MASGTRFELNHDGVRELLQSPGVLADLAARAGRVAAAAGPGMEVSTFIGRNRARVSVITATTEARLAEAHHRTLTSAIDAARG